MTSSTLAGDRRWGSARRGGMTVLGKVAVPKPINLPSQRLENHGLDPSVEIVPKGSLSWGSRSSSSATNAWGSSSLSPHPDGSTSSSSQLGARPLSGGSGTRPSTGGSDRPTDSTGNSWAPNSRPSSASGALASNQSSLASLRPRSAETRPASSQLSRFAEPVSNTSGAWGASGTPERLGVISSKKDDFSLSSGDFPTLGSDKDNPGKSTELKDPGSRSRPSSASGRLAQPKDKTTISHVEVANGTADTWGKDGSQSVVDGGQPSIDKWQGDSQQFFNPNFPPQHFDAWRGPPINAPAGVWYRGPPGGPPYGAPVGPGGFPLEPFPYFGPQIPPPAFANSRPIPPPRGGPRGPHPKSGNAYRPQMPDAYVRPGMQFRPGFYPPPMAFEGYYGPPMGYCNSNERDIPFMGMGPGPSVYDRCSAPNAPDPRDSHVRAGGPGHSGKTASDDVDPVYSGDSRRPYKVLLKQHNEWDGKDQGENHAHMSPANALLPIKDDKTGIIPRKYEWGAEDDGDEDIYSPHNFDNRGRYAVGAKSSEGSGSMKPADDTWLKKPENVTSSLGVSQVSTANRRDSALSTKNGATLIQKLEGLNAKVRGTDGRVDYASSGEEQTRNLTTHNAKVDTSTKKAGKSADSSTNTAGKSSELVEESSAPGYFAPSSRGVVVSVGDRASQPAVAMSRKHYHGVSSGTDNQGKKGKFSNQDADGWQRKPVAAEFLNVGSASKVEATHNLQGHGPQQAVEAARNNPPANYQVELVPQSQDSADSQAQHDKVSELKQRAIQLKKEEEERTREQKAKALAKLEELNRRMQSGDESNQTTRKPRTSGTSKMDQEGRIVEPRESVTPVEASIHVTPLETGVVSLSNEKSGGQVIGSAIPSQSLPVETSKTMKVESVPFDESVPLKQDVVDASGSDAKSAPQPNEGGVSKLKRTNYKPKHNIATQKNLNEKSTPVAACEERKSPVDISISDGASNSVASSEFGPNNQPYLPNNSVTVSESSAPQRRRINKSNKNKNKQGDVSSIATVTTTVPNVSGPPKASDENVRSHSNLDLKFGSIEEVITVEIGVEHLEQRSLHSEEIHERVNQSKPQSSRRIPRNQQANRFVDKFHGSDGVMWAPVRQNKAENDAEAAVERDQKPIAGSISPAKCDNTVQNSSKSKRAEMERYVPKPVAKELAQQVSLQNSESSSSDHASQQPSSSTTGNNGSPVQSRDGVAKNSKQGKVHGAWRPKGSTELSDTPNVQQGSTSTFDPPKGSQEAILKTQTLNLQATSAKAENKTSSEVNASDNRVASSNSDASASDPHPVLKDQGVAGKGSRHPYRGHRNMGHSHNNDNKNISNSGTEPSHQPDSDMNQSDRGFAPKETRATGERMSSHWLQKSHPISVSSQKGSRSTGSQSNDVDSSKVIRKDYPRRQRVKSPPQHDESNEIDAPDRSRSENKTVIEVQKSGNHEPRRERKSTSSRGRPYSPNQNPVATDESGPVDTQHEQRFSSGSRRHGNPISHIGRGHESRGDWSEQDSRQHYVATNRDRQRRTMHYEYQPVGSHNITKNNFEGPVDGSRNAGPRYKDRGQGYPKRGGRSFHGRQGDGLQVDAGCD